jgi:hypothetical protein
VLSKSKRKEVKTMHNKGPSSIIRQKNIVSNDLCRTMKTTVTIGADAHAAPDRG